MPLQYTELPFVDTHARLMRHGTMRKLYYLGLSRPLDENCCINCVSVRRSFSSGGRRPPSPTCYDCYRMTLLHDVPKHVNKFRSVKNNHESNVENPPPSVTLRYTYILRHEKT